MGNVNCSDCGKQIDLDTEDDYSFCQEDNSFLCSECSLKGDDKNDILQTDAHTGSEYWEGKL